MANVAIVDAPGVLEVPLSDEFEIFELSSGPTFEQLELSCQLASDPMQNHRHYVLFHCKRLHTYGKRSCFWFSSSLDISCLIREISTTGLSQEAIDDGWLRLETREIEDWGEVTIFYNPKTQKGLCAVLRERLL